MLAEQALLNHLITAGNSQPRLSLSRQGRRLKETRNELSEIAPIPRVPPMSFFI